MQACACLVTVSGDLYKRDTFPIHTLCSVPSVSVLERFDSRKSDRIWEGIPQLWDCGRKGLITIANNTYHQLITCLS